MSFSVLTLPDVQTDSLTPPASNLASAPELTAPAKEVPRTDPVVPQPAAGLPETGHSAQAVGVEASSTVTRAETQTANEADLIAEQIFADHGEPF